MGRVEIDFLGEKHLPDGAQHQDSAQRQLHAMDRQRNYQQCGRRG